jgi:hypothetical protein
VVEDALAARMVIRLWCEHGNPQGRVSGIVCTELSRTREGKQPPVLNSCSMERKWLVF